MPKRVQKKDNPTKRTTLVEDFNSEKLKNSIRSAGLQAGRNEEELVGIVEEVAGYVLENLEEVEEVSSQTIRKLVLEYLKENYPDIYQAWIEYDKTVKGRVDEL
ncbi:MAG: ATP cone domain-containing protein [Candidatus Aenigmatarchaeota archaeon]